MAAINSVLSVTDRMTNPLQSITRAMGSSLTAMRAIEGVNLGSEFAQAAADVRLAERAIDEMNRELGESVQAAEQASGSYTVMKGALASMVAMGIQKAIAALQQFASDMITTAATVNAENAMFSQTFKDMGDEAGAAIHRVASESGMLDAQLKVSGASIYSFARSSGASTAEGMTLMETALQAAADSAAYFNISVDSATDTLMSFLKGNYANDAALGVSATETTRNAAAMAEFGKKYANLTEIQKQQTLLKMVTNAQELSGAMGQAARESASFESVTGRLNEAWRQFQAEVGKPFLDATIPAIERVTDAITYMRENWETIAPVIAGVASGIIAGAVALGVYTVAQWIATGAATAFFTALLANPLTWIVVAIGVVVGAIARWVVAVGGVKIAWLIMQDYLLMGWDSINIGFAVGVAAVQDALDSMSLGFSRVGASIAGFMGDMKVNVLTILQNMVNGAINLINRFISAVNNIPGVGIEAISQVTFAANAAAENETAKAARAAGIVQKEQAVEQSKLERQESIKSMASAARASHSERQANILAMQTAKSSEATAQSVGTLSENVANLTDGSGSGSKMKTTGDVSIDAEDIKLMLDLATERAKITYQTIQPQLNLSVDTIRENVDIDYVAESLAVMLEEAADARVVYA